MMNTSITDEDYKWQPVETFMLSLNYLVVKKTISILLLFQLDEHLQFSAPRITIFL